MNFNKVFFRVDASPLIGSGHIMRCITLGNEFIKNGKDVFILFEKNHTTLFKKFSSNKIIFKKINLIKKFNFYKEILDYNSLIIVDNYKINYSWEKRIKKLVYKLIVIDDLASKKHNCDILIDQNFKRKKNDYKNLVPKKCKILAGINYAIIRDEFLKIKKKRIKKDYILISLGNYDPNFATYKCLKEVLQKETGFKIIVIVSIKSQSYNKIKELQNLYTFKIFSDIDYIAKLMNKSFISIGAGGSTSWERCFMGLPTIVVKLANNQNFIIKELVRSKISYYAGNIKSNHLNISQGIDYFLNKKNYNMSIKNSKKLIDGLGKKRIINEISKI